MNLAGKHILVTGGTGFLGSALVRGLLRRGARVRSLDNDSRGRRHRLEDVGTEVELITGDIRDAETVRAAVRGVDLVCHLAYINGTEYFYSKPELVLEVAVKGMMNVLDACRTEGVRQLALASTSEVYQAPPVIPTPEEVPLVVPDVLNPRYSYGGGKIISELLAINYGRNFFERSLIFRPHNVYGPDMGGEHVIPQLAMRMREIFGQQPEGIVEIPIQGSGVETRSFIYVGDFIDALLLVLEKGEHLGIYHLGSGEETSVASLTHAIAGCLNRVVTVKPSAVLPGSVARRCPDISKLRALGFRPATSLKEGLRSTVSWYFTQNPS